MKSPFRSIRVVRLTVLLAAAATLCGCVAPGYHVSGIYGSGYYGPYEDGYYNAYYGVPYYGAPYYGDYYGGPTYSPFYQGFYGGYYVPRYHRGGHDLDDRGAHHHWRGTGRRTQHRTRATGPTGLRSTASHFHRGGRFHGHARGAGGFHRHPHH